MGIVICMGILFGASTFMVVAMPYKSQICEKRAHKSLNYCARGKKADL